MSHHYLKIPFTIRSWYPGVAPGEWRETIWSDVTEDGQKLVFERLPANELGERLALHGDHFYVQVGRDKERSDTLYVIRIEPADKNLPRSTPVRLECRIELWPGGNPALKDPIGPLFRSNGNPTRPDDYNKEMHETDDEEATDFAQPSPLLFSVLEQAPSETRKRFRPGEAVPEPAEARAFLDMFAAVWRRGRLDQFVSASARQESLLKGLVKPPALGRKERDRLLVLFAFAALNKAALQHRHDSTRFFVLLDYFGGLCLHPAVRALTWTSILAGLEPSQLREELFASSDGLKRLAVEGVPAEKAWEDGLLKSIRAVATRRQDQALKSVVENAEAAEDPVGYIAAWAAELAFKPERKHEVVISTGPSVSTAALEPEITPWTDPLEPADVWAFRGAGIDPAAVAVIQKAVLSLSSAEPVLHRAIRNMTGLTSLVHLVRQLHGATEEWLKQLPEADAASAELKAAVRAYDRLRSLIPEASEELLQVTTPADVDEVCDLLEQEPILRHAPTWMWAQEGDADGFDARNAALRELSLRVAVPEKRRRFRALLAMVSQLGEVATLTWLDSPSAGQDPDQHIQVWFDRTKELLSTAPADVVEWLRSGAASLADLASLERTSQEFDRLKGQLAVEVATAVQGHVDAAGGPTQRVRLVSAYVRAVDGYREWGDPADASFSALRKKAEALLSAAAVAPHPTASPEAVVTVDHNWTETSATRATLVFNQPDVTMDYGTLAVPLVLKTAHPRHLDVRFAVEVKGDLRTAWPKEWPDISPSEPLAIPLYSWRQQSDGDMWEFPTALHVPVRKRPLEAAGKLEIGVRIEDPHSLRALGPTASLKWDSIAMQMPPIELRWAGTTNPEYVRTHPIGPQAQAADILGRLKGGGSVAVIAPRRFGKSTLVEFLLGDGREEAMLIPPAVVCTEYAAAGGLDYDRLWSDVSTWFYKNVGASLPPGHAGALPEASAFDQIRIAAKGKKYERIVVLFDEAQLFFPHAGGADLGTRLKNLLERYWSRDDDRAKTPVLFGFVGLPSMRERGGADLMALLAPIEKSVIQESQLRRLIGGMTSHLQTTRAARTKLAEVAGNLFILRVLLDRLVTRLRAQTRVWANSADVYGVETELRRELLAGREEDVARYIRDALNGAERITDWEPIPAFAVAAALADIRQQGRPQQETMTRLVAHLNEWCRLNASETDVRAVYDEESVSRHLVQLRERRVLRDLDFSSSLLEAWLQGVARAGAYDGLRTALFRGAQRRIQLPAGCEQVAKGGQAEIWRAAAPDGQGQVAYRIRAFESAREEEQFQGSMDMFDALRSGLLRREPGCDCIFDLLDVGLAADDPRKAILVYRWIDGHDLSFRLGQLPGDIVVDLGAKLSRALRLIHSRNILHRDIRPPNIVLDDSVMRPVLIDFGFARRAGGEMNTRLAGDFCAPEARSDRPMWTKAADVYSLAATLRALTKPQDVGAPDLKRLLDGALAPQPEDRPSAEGLLEQFEGLDRDRHLEQKRQDVWVHLRRAADTDKHKPWFSGVMNKFRPRLEALALGFYATPIQRYREIADFLNQLLESYPSGGLTLKSLAGRYPDDPDLPILVVVRNSDAHSGQALSREARDLLQGFQARESARQLDSMSTGIAIVARHLELASLPGVLGPLLGPGTVSRNK